MRSGYSPLETLIKIMFISIVRHADHCYHIYDSPCTSIITHTNLLLLLSTDQITRIEKDSFKFETCLKKMLIVSYDCLPLPSFCHIRCGMLLFLNLLLLLHVLLFSHGADHFPNLLPTQPFLENTHNYRETFVVYV